MELRCARRRATRSARYGSSEMFGLEIICVGKQSADFFRDGTQEYVKRLGAYDRVTVTELPEYRIGRDTEAARREAVRREGEEILSRLQSRPRALKVALCIEGKQVSSEELAELLERAKAEQGSAVFVIGGSAGLSEEVKKACDVRMSMSRMTFPHQMARLILAEQLYRAESINNGGKYHK